MKCLNEMMYPTCEGSSMDNSVYSELLKEIREEPRALFCDVDVNERMAPHTTFRIGGVADLLLTPHTGDGLCRILSRLVQDHIPYRVIGNASNLLIDDEGYRGVFVRTILLRDITFDGTFLIAETGASLARVAQMAMEKGLSGFEKLSGIPGSVGGALAMNAGAYGQEIAALVSFVDAFDTKRNCVVRLTKEELRFSYRQSAVSDQSLVVLRACFHLQPRNVEEIRAEMKELAEKRRQTQPLEYPSAGSVFKRPPHDYAGRLIEAAGLKGARIGDAEVSEKHAGFIVNRGHATASDVRLLIQLIQERVRAESDVLLLPEIDMIFGR